MWKCERQRERWSMFEVHEESVDVLVYLLCVEKGECRKRTELP